MAKEKAGGTVLLRGTVTQGAANGFAQVGLLTGLVSSGNDALIVKQVILEFGSYINAAAGIVEIEAAVSRAAKVVMPNVYDDDVLFKNKVSQYWGSGATINQPTLLYYVPPTEIVVIEDILYFPFKTLNLAAIQTLNIVVIAQPATVTDSEKVGLLLTRIN